MKARRVLGDATATVLLVTLAVGLVPALFGTTTHTTDAAQGDEPTPENREWHLASYALDGRVRHVPGDVDTTLPLEGGRIYGSAGCNGFDGTYEIDGQSLSIGVGTNTDVACEQAAMRVEEAYMATLPRTASWAIDVYRDTGPTPIRGHNLVLYDSGGDPILEFVEPSVDEMFASLRALSAEVAAQQKEIDRLTRQVATLRREVRE